MWQEQTNMEENKNLKKKLEFIESFVYFHGIVNREDVTNKFNISPASATNLLSEYIQKAPKNLNYNVRLKCYEISKSFKPIFGTRVFFERIPIYTIPSLHDPIDDDEIKKIATISRAIQRIKVLQITYSSASSGVSKKQIIPVAFANTKLRLHLRAYDRKKKRYADFVCRRISEVNLIESDTILEYEHPKNDQQWHSFVDLVIKSHPYNMITDRTIDIKQVRNVKMRSAMAGYFLQLWNVDCSANAELRGRQYQYILKNVKQVSKLADLSLAPGYKYESNK